MKIQLEEAKLPTRTDVLNALRSDKRFAITMPDGAVKTFKIEEVVGQKRPGLPLCLQGTLDGAAADLWLTAHQDVYELFGKGEIEMK
jgi:hypothetical protein